MLVIMVKISYNLNCDILDNLSKAYARRFEFFKFFGLIKRRLVIGALRVSKMSQFWKLSSR
jgi:hypothetical protein